jgi:outer membrane lipoprotein LolB
MIANRTRAAWRLAWAGCLVLLAACSTTPRRAAEIGEAVDASVREAQLAAEPRWSLQGRIAVSDGKDGGSGRIEWHQDEDRFRIEIRAPVSRRTWRLSGAPGSATLEGLEGGTRHGESAEALLQAEVGWTVPVAAMVAWVRGLPAEGATERELDPDGRPLRVVQDGWLVEYRGWGDGEPSLPRKIFAVRGPQRVRLMIEGWARGDARD